MNLDPIGTALLFVAPLGITGVFALALFERLVPVLPSSGLFAAIGVAAAEGLWCLPTAVIASVLGGGTAAYGTYRFGYAAGDSHTSCASPLAPINPLISLKAGRIVRRVILLVASSRQRISYVQFPGRLGHWRQSRHWLRNR
jgi:membrane protein DedA with SNARE-associated domain